MPGYREIALISNTGPVLALSGAGCLELLRDLYSSVTVPNAVHEELVQGGKSGLGLSSYLAATWIQVEPQGRIDPLLLAQLDQGEAAVITIALNKNNQATLIEVWGQAFLIVVIEGGCIGIDCLLRPKLREKNSERWQLDQVIVGHLCLC